MNKILGIIAGLSGLLLILGAAYFYITRQATEVERAKQEKENAEFIIKANAGRSTYDQCDAADGVYDFRTSTCKLQTTGINR